LPVRRSHSRTALSLPPEARVLPSGLNASEKTWSNWRAVRGPSPLGFSPWTSHSRTWSDQPAEARVLPSGLNAHGVHGVGWPKRIVRSVPVRTSTAGPCRPPRPGLAVGAERDGFQPLVVDDAVAGDPPGRRLLVGRRAPHAEAGHDRQRRQQEQHPAEATHGTTPRPPRAGGSPSQIHRRQHLLHHGVPAVQRRVRVGHERRGGRRRPARAPGRPAAGCERLWADRDVVPWVGTGPTSFVDRARQCTRLRRAWRVHSCSTAAAVGVSTSRTVPEAIAHAGSSPRGPAHRPVANRAGPSCRRPGSGIRTSGRRCSAIPTACALSPPGGPTAAPRAGTAAPRP